MNGGEDDCGCGWDEADDLIGREKSLLDWALLGLALLMFIGIQGMAAGLAGGVGASGSSGSALPRLLVTCAAVSVMCRRGPLCTMLMGPALVWWLIAA